MRRITNHVRQNLVAYLALFVALTGTSAYAAGTVFSEDIVNGEVKTPDLDAQAVTPSKLAAETPTVASKRTAVPAGTTGGLVLDVPGFGQVRNKNCSVKSARSSLFNDTAKSVAVFTDASRFSAGGTDPQFDLLAPGEEAMGLEIEGTERAIYQVGFGANSIATIIVMGRPNGENCLYQAEAVIAD
jgi:hypothetical protein